MIRVNLLPRKREGARSVTKDRAQLWLLGILGACLLEVIGLIFFHKAKTDELAAVVSQNQRVQTNIDEIKQQISHHDEVKAQLKQLRDREEAIQKLQAARTGPTATLLELSRILTTGRGPTVDRDKLEQLKRDNPGAVPNPSWDARRLWLTQYTENERSVKILGQARDGEDVSEFVRRLTLSDYFYEVRLLPAAKAIDAATKLELVKFELSTKARY